MVEEVQEILMVGTKIYGYKGDFSKLSQEWKDLGINAAFVDASLARNEEFRKLAKENKVSIFLIVPIFQDAGAAQKRPDLSAITDKGEKARRDWACFICPTREDYRKQKIEYIKKLVEELKPDGLSLDFIRYFIYWEKVYPQMSLDYLDNTCFCEYCLEKFQGESGIRIPPKFLTVQEKANWILTNHLKKWTKWKCEVITSMIQEIAKKVRKIKPDIIIGIHAVPWRGKDFGGAIKIIAGQDFKKISPYIDFFSPMCYHHMLKRNSSWINSVVKDIYMQTKKKIIPSIQVEKYYLEEEISLKEFKKALGESLKLPSKGVIFFHWGKLEKSERKLNWLKKKEKEEQRKK